jgi:RNase H-fold protein (predicted Holliday junction resolvase)
MTVSKLLQKCLAKPCQLAQSLDWKKATGSTLLALDIHADRIGLARCDHPLGLGGLERKSDASSTSDSSCFPLESIPLCPKKKTISPENKQRLADLVKEYKVCGFVVSWPLEPDTGKLGAACGRTLFALDQLLEDSSTFSPNRPLCLWDSKHTQPTQVDNFGRSAVFARTSSKTEHVASKEQYHSDEGIVASQVWQDFCQQYWPETMKMESSAESISRKVERPSLLGSKQVTYNSESWQQANLSKRRSAMAA